jgi:hypothetical protein
VQKCAAGTMRQFAAGWSGVRQAGRQCAAGRQFAAVRVAACDSSCDGVCIFVFY